MKLSEAIRLGAMLRPQGFGDFYPVITCVHVDEVDGVWSKQEISTMSSCALGAAMEAVRSRPVADDMALDTLRFYWPWAFEMTDSWRTASPSTARAFRVTDMIFLLNDTQGWTREQIADWVATVEPNETSPATVAEMQELVTA
jgi:hypothetical protein